MRRMRKDLGILQVAIQALSQIVLLVVRTLE